MPVLKSIGNYPERKPWQTNQKNKELGPSGEKHLEIFPTLSRRCLSSGVGVVYWTQHSSQLLDTRSRGSVMDELSAVFATAEPCGHQLKDCPEIPLTIAGQKPRVLNPLCVH